MESLGWRTKQGSAGREPLSWLAMSGKYGNRRAYDGVGKRRARSLSLGERREKKLGTRLRPLGEQPSLDSLLLPDNLRSESVVSVTTGEHHRSQVIRGFAEKSSFLILTKMGTLGDMDLT